MNDKQLYQIERNLKYITSMRPVFNKKALFSDMTVDYVNPPEPELFSTVKIRFRTGKNNVDHVFFVLGEEKIVMDKVEQTDEFDFYITEVQLSDKKIEYYFEVHNGRVSCIYDMRGVAKEVQDYYKFTLVPVNIHRTGPKVQLCTRFMWIVFTTVIRPMMY